MSAGRFVEACTKLEESHQVDPAPGTLLNLADCYERIGRTASAWELFLDVAALAQSAGRVQHETLARARAGALEPKLSRLRVTVNAPSRGLSVHRDGIVLQPSDWGATFPVDPGQHVIEATAPDKWDFRIMRYVPPGAVVVTVDVPLLVEKSKPSPKAPLQTTPQAPSPPPPPHKPDEPSSGSWRQIASYTTVGLGVAALGAGTFFYADYSLRSDSKNGNDRWEETASVYSFVGAGVMLGAGLYFLLTAPSTKKPPVATASGALFVW